MKPWRWKLRNFYSPEDWNTVRSKTVEKIIMKSGRRRKIDYQFIWKFPRKSFFLIHKFPKFENLALKALNINFGLLQVSKFNSKTLKIYLEIDQQVLWIQAPKALNINSEFTNFESALSKALGYCFFKFKSCTPEDPKRYIKILKCSFKNFIIYRTELWNLSYFLACLNWVLTWKFNE